MRRQAVKDLGKYLLTGRVSQRGCLKSRQAVTPLIFARPSATTTTQTSLYPVRHQHDAPRATATSQSTTGPPNFRKKLKDEAKLAKLDAKKKPKSEAQTVDGWELTVGIEIHAQLNSPYKLFASSSAPTPAASLNDQPNSHVALFDVAMPGSQPRFQKETLLPAIRAALSLNCEVQHTSRFDRKHYFWWDQPSGYQITQYCQPFAKNGHITLLARDGIAAQDGKSITVGIKQIQLEQDTAKTLTQVGNVQWLDFNRVGAPLVEIITEPEIHYPRTAAAFVRKVQLLLSTVDACVSGMETGGLRADVNVSVRRTGDDDIPLGTRTEIKNLSTVKSIEEAIIAERDRQIRELESGGVIVGETRGWAVGSTETRRLRSKEGEVDYRYMPDPDIEPLIISYHLVEHLRESLAVLPDRELDSLVDDYGLTAKDALSLITLDGGGRVQYFYRVLDILGKSFQDSGMKPNFKSYATLVGNWVIHEVGRLATYKTGPLASGELTFTQDGECAQVPAEQLAQLLHHLYRKKITGKVAKELLVAIYLDEVGEDVTASIDANDLWFHELSQEEYLKIAEEAMQNEDKVLKEFVSCDKFPQGKLMFLVGKMMRLGPTEKIDPSTAETVMRAKVKGLRIEKAAS